MSHSTRARYFAPPPRIKNMLKYIKRETRKKSIGWGLSVSMIKKGCKFACSLDAIRRELNARGYFWLPVQRAADLSATDRRERLAFCRRYVDMPPSKLKRAMGPILDEETFMAPLTQAERLFHMRMGIRRFWRKKSGRGKITLPGKHNRPSRGTNKKPPIIGCILGDKVVLGDKQKGPLSAAKFLAEDGESLQAAQLQEVAYG